MIQSTTIREGHGFLVEILISDQNDQESASERIEICVRVGSADDQDPLLSSLQRAALARAQQLIDDEVRRLESSQHVDPQ
jgi:hypothetical protein